VVPIEDEFTTGAIIELEPVYITASAPSRQLAPSAQIVLERIEQIAARKENPSRSLSGRGETEHPLRRDAQFGRRLPAEALIEVVRNHSAALEAELVERYGEDAAEATIKEIRKLAVGVVRQRIRGAALDRIEASIDQFESLTTMTDSEFRSRVESAVSQVSNREELAELFQCFGMRRGEARRLAEDVQSHGGEVCAHHIESLRGSLGRGLRNLERAHELARTPTALSQALRSEQFESVRGEVYAELGVRAGGGEPLSDAVKRARVAEKRVDFAGNVALAAFSVALSIGTGGLFGVTMLGFRAGTTAAVTQAAVSATAYSTVGISHIGTERGQAIAGNREFESVSTVGGAVAGSLLQETVGLGVSRIPQVGHTARNLSALAAEFGNELAGFEGVYVDAAEQVVRGVRELDF
jgi:hypothetical protein